MEYIRINGLSCPPIIGLHGPRGVGKSTLANELAKYTSSKVMSFASPLRRMLRTLGLSHDELKYLKDTELDVIDRTPRYMLQTLGTEWGRNMVHPDIWVYSLLRRMERAGAREQISRFIIDDVRFDNEGAVLKDKGGLIFELKRNNHTPPDDGSVENHPSDMPMDPALVDYTLEGDDSNTMLANALKILRSI